MARPLVGVFVVALLVRLALVAATPGYVPRHDDRDYDRVGWSMASGRSYPPVRVGGVRYADAYRPPLWPATLGLVYAAAGHRIGAARVAAAALGALDVVLLAWVAFALLGPVAARWAGALGAVYLPLALVSSVLLSETLFVAFVLLALGLGLRGHGAGAGAAVGLATLTHVNGLVVLPAVLALLWPRRAPVAALACVAVIAPWTVRNALELHAFVPVSTEGGSTLAGTYNRDALTDRRDPGAWRLPHKTEYRAIALRPLPPVRHDAVLRDAALRFIAHHPAYPAAVAAFNLPRLLGLAGVRRARFEASTADIASPWADAALPFAWALAALALVAGLPRGTPRAFWLAPLALLATTLLVNAETPRFRAPLDPFLILLVAASAQNARVADRIPARLRPHAQAVRSGAHADAA